MSHVRQQLRDAVVARLTGLATTGARVFASRVYPLQTKELPGLTVFVTSESVQLGTLDNIQQRDVALSVGGYAKASAELDDVLDQIALEVETALGALIPIGSGTTPLDYQGCEIEMVGEGEQPAGCILLNYLATIYTASGAPDAALNG